MVLGMVSCRVAENTTKGLEGIGPHPEFDEANTGQEEGASEAQAGRGEARVSFRACAMGPGGRPHSHDSNASPVPVAVPVLNWLGERLRDCRRIRNPKARGPQSRMVTILRSSSRFYRPCATAAETRGPA
jgi:hypothetical protein